MKVRFTMERRKEKENYILKMVKLFLKEYSIKISLLKVKK
jgi:hypothetical protein